MSQIVIKKIEELNQSEFKAKIILDMDYQLQSVDNNIGRQAVFECAECKIKYTNTVSIEKNKQKPLCIECYEKQKYNIIQPLNQDDFNAEILFDTEYRTKLRMDKREAIFKCISCHEPFIDTTANQKVFNIAKCNYCIDHKEEPLNQENFDIKLLKDLGMVKTSKHVKAHFGEFECKQCNQPFIRKVSKVQYQKAFICDKCKAINSYNNISRISRIWQNMKSRTLKNMQEDNYYWNSYGSKGIQLCDEWRNFKTFEEWSLNNGYSDILSIDRIDNDGNYEPSNCRWANQMIQSQNTRKLRSTNTLGYRGIRQNTNKTKYMAQISVNNIRYSLGTYDTKEEAALAYDNYIDENDLSHTKNFES